MFIEPVFDVCICKITEINFEFKSWNKPLFLLRDFAESETLRVRWNSFPKKLREYNYRVAFHNRHAGNICGIYYAHANLCLIQRRKAWLAYAEESANAVRSTVDSLNRESRDPMQSPKKQQTGGRSVQQVKNKTVIIFDNFK